MPAQETVKLALAVSPTPITTPRGLPPCTEQLAAISVSPMTWVSALSSVSVVAPAGPIARTSAPSRKTM